MMTFNLIKIKLGIHATVLYLIITLGDWHKDINIQGFSATPWKFDTVCY